MDVDEGDDGGGYVSPDPSSTVDHEEVAPPRHSAGAEGIAAPAPDVQVRLGEGPRSRCWGHRYSPTPARASREKKEENLMLKAEDGQSRVAEARL